MEEDFIIDNSELATIKKANEQIKVSKEEFERRIKIIAKSKRDIVWWAEHFFRIVSLNTGLGVIKLYEKQKQLLTHIATNDRSIVLAARQTGKTTTYTVFCLWLATLFPEQKIMICANKFQTAIEIMNRIRIAYEYLPSFIKPGILVYNKSEISFANQSRICCYSTSSTSSRGSSSNCVTGDTKVTVKDDFGNIFNCNISDVEYLVAQEQLNTNQKILYIDD